jgi:hypothetical protein
LASGRPSAAGAAIAILLLGDASKSEAQVGARYRARDPQTCASRKDPAKGPITADLAKKYVTCHIEAESSGKLYLLENVTVEVGKGTPFKELPSSARPFGGDPDGLVYQIRGSLTRYQCAPSATSSRMRARTATSIRSRRLPARVSATASPTGCAT